MNTLVGLYCVDQDLATTTTVGVYNYTRNLIAALARMPPPPDLDMVLWLSEANAADFQPDRVPDWIGVRVLPGTYGTGFRRLHADHVTSLRLARRDRVDAVHFPKGWVPIALSGRLRIVTTLHDAIPLAYPRLWPQYGSRLKWTYFGAMIRRALRRADRIIAPSQFTSAQLVTLRPQKASRITVIPTGAIDHLPPPAAAAANRHGLLVPGATAPHKATGETLQLLSEYAAARKISLDVTVSGIDRAPPEVPLDAMARLRTTFTGRLPPDKFRALMQQSRAVIFLSHIEGFGLPSLEAYSDLTPVCYRRDGAIGEVLAGIPGGWDGVSFGSFARALDDTLALTPGRIKDIRATLAHRFSWNDIAAQTVAVYRAAIRGRPRGAGPAV